VGGSGRSGRRPASGDTSGATPPDGPRGEDAQDPSRPGGPAAEAARTDGSADGERTASDDRTESESRTESDSRTDGDEPWGDADGGPDREPADEAERAERARHEAEDARDEAEGARDQAVTAEQGAMRAREDARDEARRVSDVAEVIADADPIVDEDVRKAEAGVDEENPFGRPGRPMSRRSPFRIGFGGALGVGVAYLLYRALVNAESVIVLVVVSAFLAIGLNPTVSRLERLGLRRGAAVGGVFLAVALFFSVVGYAILPPLVEQGSRFVRSLPQYVADLKKNRSLADLDKRFHVIDRAQDYLTHRFGDQAASNILSLGSTVASTVFKGLTILILTLYFLSYFNQITQTAYRLVPRSRRARATLLGDEILGRVGGYVAGAFVVALIAGTASLIMLASLGVAYPLALALVVMITDIIPLIGATVGAAAVTVIVLIGSLPKGIAVLVFFLIYQQVENYVVYPRVMKRSVDINPAAAIVGALVGGTLLGIVGALLAVPATAAIQLIVREVVLPRQDSA
jgi:predicted PurR-regulated permease PerM